MKKIFGKIRLTSWHVYSTALFIVIANGLYGGITDGYEGYLLREDIYTPSEFENILFWFAVFCVIFVADMIGSIYSWYKRINK